MSRLPRIELAGAVHQLTTGASRNCTESVLPSLIENGESERHHAPEEAQELTRCFFLHLPVAIALLRTPVSKVGEYLRRFRRIHHVLREEDADHSLYGIGVRRGAKAAVPPESGPGVRKISLR